MRVDGRSACGAHSLPGSYGARRAQVTTSVEAGIELTYLVVWGDAGVADHSVSNPRSDGIFASMSMRPISILERGAR